MAELRDALFPSADSLATRHPQQDGVTGEEDDLGDKCDGDLQAQQPTLNHETVVSSHRTEAPGLRSGSPDREATNAAARTPVKGSDPRSGITGRGIIHEGNPQEPWAPTPDTSSDEHEEREAGAMARGRSAEAPYDFARSTEDNYGSTERCGFVGRHAKLRSRLDYEYHKYYSRTRQHVQVWPHIPPGSHVACVSSHGRVGRRRTSRACTRSRKRSRRS